MATIEDMPHRVGYVGYCSMSGLATVKLIIITLQSSTGTSESRKGLPTSYLSERVLASALNVPYCRGTGLGSPAIRVG